MFLQTLLKIFPPPNFLVMPHIGLDISDDAINVLEYGSKFGRTYIKKYNSIDLPDGLIVGGDITDQGKLISLLKSVRASLHANSKSADKSLEIIHAKVSIPEEKAYLFQTDVPSISTSSIYQNVESKLEENVPLSAKDALLHFDLIAPVSPGGSLRASVSVVPRTYIEHLSAILNEVNICPMSFETVPSALTHIVIPPHSKETILIANLMRHKTGLYVVSSGIVCFSSTIVKDLSPDTSGMSDAEALVHEITRVDEYWSSRIGTNPIDRVVLIGRDALKYEKELGGTILELSIPVSVVNIWDNIFDDKKIILPLDHETSLPYAVTAGLAIL